MDINNKINKMLIQKEKRKEYQKEYYKRKKQQKLNNEIIPISNEKSPPIKIINNNMTIKRDNIVRFD